MFSNIFQNLVESNYLTNLLIKEKKTEYKGKKNLKIDFYNLLQQINRPNCKRKTYFLKR